MRRAAMVLAVVCALCAAPLAHAGVLAGCSGTAPTIGGSVTAPSFTFVATCRAPLYLANDGDVTVHLTPSPDFAGTLTATLRRASPPDSRDVRTFVIAGEALYSGTKMFHLGPGDWDLEVKAGGPPPCGDQVACHLPSIAAGDFSGNVTA